MPYVQLDGRLGSSEIDILQRRALPDAKGPFLVVVSRAAIYASCAILRCPCKDGCVRSQENLSVVAPRSRYVTKRVPVEA